MEDQVWLVVQSGLTRQSKSLPLVAGRRKSAAPFTLVVNYHERIH